MASGKIGNKKVKKTVKVKPSAGDVNELIKAEDVLTVLVPGLRSLYNVKRGVLAYGLTDMEKSIDKLFKEGDDFKIELKSKKTDITAIMIKVEHWKNIVIDLVDDVLIELNKCIKDDNER